MMQKWQIRTSLCKTIRPSHPLRSSQCAFSTSHPRRDDEKPRSNRQASAKAGRLIANLASKNAADRSKDPKFGLRGLKPYTEGSDGIPENQWRGGPSPSGPLTFRKVGVSNRDPPTSRTSNGPRPAPQERKPGQFTITKFNAPDRDGPVPRPRESTAPRPRPSRGAQYAGAGHDAGLKGFDGDQYQQQNMVENEEEEELPTEPIQEEWEYEREVDDEFRLTAEDVGEDIAYQEVIDSEGNVKFVFDEDVYDEEEDGNQEIDDDEDAKADDAKDGEEDRDLDSEDEDYAENLEQSIYAAMETTERELGPGVTPYNPKTMKAEDLHTSFIGLAAGELGVASAAKQAMGRLGRRSDLDYQFDAELASRLYRGEVVRFRDAEEKKRVVAMAEEFASNTANRIMAKKGEWEPKKDVGFVPVPEAVKEQLAGKAMRGLYPPVPSVDGEDIQEKTMAHLRKSVLLNETYSPTQGKSMVDFIAQMWPVEPAEPSSKPSTSDRRKKT